MTTVPSYADVLSSLLQRKRAPTAKTINDAAMWLDRNEYPQLVLDLYDKGALTSRSASYVVPAAWSLAEHPLRRLSRGDWYALFEGAGYTEDMRPAVLPTEPLTLFRGATAERRTDWSWTSDRATAERFVKIRSYEGDTKVWTASVEPWRLLAYIGESGRGESEYVVDAGGMPGITEAV